RRRSSPRTCASRGWAGTGRRTSTAPGWWPWRARRAACATTRFSCPTKHWPKRSAVPCRAFFGNILAASRLLSPRGSSMDRRPALNTSDVCEQVSIVRVIRSGGQSCTTDGRPEPLESRRMLSVAPVATDDSYDLDLDGQIGVDVTDPASLPAFD